MGGMGTQSRVIEMGVECEVGPLAWIFFFFGFPPSSLYFFQFPVMMSVCNASHSNCIFTAGTIFTVITTMPILELQIKRLHFLN